MNKLSDELANTSVCPQCFKKNHTNFIEPDPQMSLMCSSCGCNYFPFRNAIDEHEPPNLNI